MINSLMLFKTELYGHRVFNINGFASLMPGLPVGHVSNNPFSLCIQKRIYSPYGLYIRYLARSGNNKINNYRTGDIPFYCFCRVFKVTSYPGHHCILAPGELRHLLHYNKNILSCGFAAHSHALHS